jgi:hypothetical protein
MAAPATYGEHFTKLTIMSILNGILGLRYFRYLLGLGMLASINGCVPVPGSSRYFEHDIRANIDGRRYDFKQYFECSKSLDFSEADNGLHAHWHRSGDGFSTADIGNGRVLVYAVSGDCESDYQEIHAPSDTPMAVYSHDAVRILDSASSPQKLYVLTGTAPGSSVKIEQESVKRLAHIEGGIGPHKAELALKELVRANQHGFQRVTVTVIPFAVWGAADAARQYFSRFKAVTVAKVGEAPPVSGRADALVRFPYYLNRLYQKGSSGEIVGLFESDAVYDGDTFKLNDSPREGVQIWYATNETRSAGNLAVTPVAVVNYKGTVFQVAQLQEIYDPETRNILQFSSWHAPYPWGGPEPADVERLMRSR